MREIKFRAWNSNLNLMQYGEGDQGLFLQKALERNFEIMQYTGLKDKNGKEIYEKDTIMIDAVDFSHRFPETIDDIFKAHNLVGDSKTHWEVVGDVYEDSNLLEHKQENSKVVYDWAN